MLTRNLIWSVIKLLVIAAIASVGVYLHGSAFAPNPGKMLVKEHGADEIVTQDENSEDSDDSESSSGDDADDRRATRDTEKRNAGDDPENVRAVNEKSRHQTSLQFRVP